MNPSFRVLEKGAWPIKTPHTWSLIRDLWDDYTFKTLYVLYYTGIDGEPIEIGAVKIGQTDLGEGHASPTVSRAFERLAPNQYSLGQDREYYERIASLGDVGRRALVALKDIALDASLFEAVIDEPVTQVSLLRNLDVKTVAEQFRRIVHGGDAVTAYNFAYIYPNTQGGTPPPTLSFRVSPGSMPPTNVHVVIGSNGVGKTSLLRRMANAAYGARAGDGTFVDFQSGAGRSPFAGLVTIAFSAFDPFEPPLGFGNGMKYTYVGLKDHDRPDVVKDPRALAQDFSRSLAVCARGARRARWERAIEVLCVDPLLRDSGIQHALRNGMDFDVDAVEELFHRLSSGHKIVVLTTTRLIESVEERTLVLVDEPEAHLHPPLLSAFTRVVSELLEDRNGVAIIATHSPVVLQEIPRECAWRIARVGDVVSAGRLDIETFGESVGVLTASVFNLEVTRTGYHQLLRQAAAQSLSYESALASFQGKLGGEGRAILRNLTAWPER